MPLDPSEAFRLDIKRISIIKFEDAQGSSSLVRNSCYKILFLKRERCEFDEVGFIVCSGLFDQLC